MSGTRRTGKKAAIIVENGFCEREFIQAENALKKIGINARVISANAELVESWCEEKQTNQSHWGQKYASHGFLKDQIVSDYEVLVLPAGIRSLNKLRQVPELKSFISGFLNTGKPTIIYNNAVDILLSNQMTNGYSIAAKDEMCDILNKSGQRCASKDFVVSKNLITLSRYRDVEEKLTHAITAILNNEPYVEKTVSSDTLPRSHQAA